MLLIALLWLGGSPRALAQAARSYTVVSGDTLFVIAQQFGVPMEEIITLNNIADANALEVGQVLLIPASGGDASAPAAGLPTADVATVRVTPGDTLAAVATRYGLATDQVAALNSLDVNARLFPGQPLIVPRVALASEPLRFGAVQTVQMPGSLIQGRTGRVLVETARPLALFGVWNGLPISFTPIQGDPQRQFAYLPVPALIAPASYWLTISYTATSGLLLNQTWAIAVGEGVYESQVIDVPADRGELLEPTLVQSELEKLQAAWSGRTPQLYWTDVFSRPISAEYPTTSAFGTRRTYSGGSSVISYHEGEDLGAPAGVPVTAPGDGVVVVAEVLNVRGYAIMVDHGGGVFSGYWHLSEILVTPGQTVKQGDTLGLVGNSGLSTGAHLHWELRIYGIAVDPLQFLEETLEMGS